MAKKNYTSFFEDKLLDFITAKYPTLEMIDEFRTRKLESEYPVIWTDALYEKICGSMSYFQAFFELKLRTGMDAIVHRAGKFFFAMKNSLYG